MEDPNYSRTSFRMRTMKMMQKATIEFALLQAQPSFPTRIHSSKLPFSKPMKGSTTIEGQNRV